MLRCNACAYVCKGKYNMRKHIKVKHGQDISNEEILDICRMNDETQPVIDDKDNILQCEICHKAFTTVCRFNNHKNVCKDKQHISTESDVKNANNTDFSDIPDELKQLVRKIIHRVIGEELKEELNSVPQEEYMLTCKSIIQDYLNVSLHRGLELKKEQVVKEICQQQEMLCNNILNT